LKVVQQGHDKGVEDGPLEATHLPQRTPRNRASYIQNIPWHYNNFPHVLYIKIIYVQYICIIIDIMDIII
jgi:hypothetical protein